MIMMKLFHIYLASQIIAISPNLPDSQPTTFPVEAVGDFHVVDVHSPPTDGLWMNWDESRRFARALNTERNEWKILYFRQQRDSLFNHGNDTVNGAQASQFWSKWGLPIGIGIGIFLSVGIGVATFEATKR